MTNFFPSKSTLVHTALVSLFALGLSGCKASASMSTETPEAAPAEEPAPAPEPEAAPAEDPSDVHIEGDHLTMLAVYQASGEPRARSHEPRATGYVTGYARQVARCEWQV